jgi:cell wall-associated NlpC family hydrolase
MSRVSLGARLRAGLVTAAMTGAALTATATVSTPAAHAATSAAQARAAKINKVLSWAHAERGKPYRYGAAGPSAFDCSGFTMYVYRHALGKRLSHNAESQYHQVQHISRRSLRPGDLVFASSGGSGSIYHVGIYAGNGYFWHAPHSGTVVKKAKMYSAHWYYGRIIH